MAMLGRSLLHVQSHSVACSCASGRGFRHVCGRRLHAGAAGRTPNRITGTYVGCTTKAALDEFATAANNNDLRQMQALTGTVCTSIEGQEYSIVDRGWMTSQIRVYGNGTSAVLWTVSEAIKSGQ